MPLKTTIKAHAGHIEWRVNDASKLSSAAVSSAPLTAAGAEWKWILTFFPAGRAEESQEAGIPRASLLIRLASNPSDELGRSNGKGRCDSRLLQVRYRLAVGDDQAVHHGAMSYDGGSPSVIIQLCPHHSLRLLASSEDELLFKLDIEVTDQTSSAAACIEASGAANETVRGKRTRCESC